MAYYSDGKRVLASSGAIDDVVIGGITPAAGDFTLLGVDAALAGTASAPAIAFGDGDTGFFESADDDVRLAMSGVGSWRFTINEVSAIGFGNSPIILNEAATATNPTFAPARDDMDTGIGHAAADQLSLIAGGVEVHQVSESSGAAKNTFMGVNGALVDLQTASTEVTGMSGATVTASNLIPAGSSIVGVTIRVTTTITGATTFTIGDGVDADRWGTGIALAAGTTTDITDFTADGSGQFATANDVVLTATGANFTAGAVRLIVHYFSLTPATS